MERQADLGAAEAIWDVRILEDEDANLDAACFHGCAAIYRFDPHGLVFRYKLACGHLCERHDQEHRCCVCRGLRASGLARRNKL